MSKETKYFGVLAEFDTPAQVYHACEQVRDQGFKKWDAHTPFPVHGLEKAMGLPASKLPWFVLVMGLTGVCIAISMQYFMNTVDYQFVIANKPIFSWPAFVPVTFELMILFSAGTAVFGMLALNGLPRFHHPLFSSERFERVTDDKFFISIEAKDKKFDAEKTKAFLEEIGATHVELIED